MLYAQPVAETPVDLVKRVPIFSTLDARELGEIAGSMRQRTFPAGSTVVEQGEQGVGFFVIESGTAKVSVDGKEVGTLRDGDHFGEIALIGDTPRTATIVAETELNCYGMIVWDFKPLVEKNATIAWKILQTLAQRLARAEQPAA